MFLSDNRRGTKIKLPFAGSGIAGIDRKLYYFSNLLRQEMKMQGMNRPISDMDSSQRMK